MPSIELRPSLDDEAAVIGALRAGDEQVFTALVDEHSPRLLQLALNHVRSRAVAEEVVQEGWIAVLRGIDRFEGRSSLKHWIFRIVRNVAINRGQGERRHVPLSSLLAPDDDEGALLEPDRFLSIDHDRYPRHWAIGPTPWPVPEDGLLAGETRDVILAAIQRLPVAQRTVFALRDIEGCPSDEVCDLLELSAGNQRVLLHRARTKVRAALEAYFGAVEPTLEEV
jgi:RNA polymerase sigma-70 factor (ECF subfamily)